MLVEGKPQTDSRVSLLTGIHRLDVKRLRNEISNGDEPLLMSCCSLGAQIVARWIANVEYLDNKGRPLPTPSARQRGGADELFQSLVCSVNKDIRPRVVLDEWLRLGVAQIDNLDRVCLVTDAFVPHDGLDEKLFYLGKNVAGPSGSMRTQPEPAERPSPARAQRVLRSPEQGLDADFVGLCSSTV